VGDQKQFGKPQQFSNWFGVPSNANHLKKKGLITKLV
jgi:hypothetical protein